MARYRLFLLLALAPALAASAAAQYTRITASQIRDANGPQGPAAAVTSNRTTGDFQVAGKLTAKGIGGFRYADQFAGATVGAQIDAAIADCGRARCTVVIPATMGPGGPSSQPENAVLVDLRKTAGGFVRGTTYTQRWTTVDSGLQIFSNLRLVTDAYRGGVNEWPGGAATKTQYEALTINSSYRTVGERHSITDETRCYGKGDCVSGMFSVYDLGGYGTGGDESLEGIRVYASVGGLGIPSGTITAISGNTVTAAWSNSTNAYLGEKRPLIVTNRATYSTGTIASATAAGRPCVMTGAGTSWSSLGLGAHSDLFIEVAQFSNSSVGQRWVVPVLNVADDTHLTVEFSVSELADTCFGSYLPAGSTYTIYKGAVVASLSDPPSGASDPVGVTTAITPSMMRVGDTVEQVLGYNSTPKGAYVMAERNFGPPLGTGINVNALGQRPIESIMRWWGRAKYGASVNINNLDTLFWIPTNPVPRLFFIGDRTGAGTTLIQLVNSAGALRIPLYWDRVADKLVVLSGVNAMIIDAATGAIGYGANPNLPSARWQYTWSDAAQGGMSINGPTGMTRPLLSLTVAGINRFFVDATTAQFNNGLLLKGYAGNQTKQTWGIDSATGNHWGAKFCYNAAQTVCDYSGAGAPTGACTTGSTYRRTDGTAGATFYVCEASSWAAK